MRESANWEYLIAEGWAEKLFECSLAPESAPQKARAQRRRQEKSDVSKMVTVVFFENFFEFRTHLQAKRATPLVSYEWYHKQENQ